VIDTLIVKNAHELNEYLRLPGSFEPARILNFFFPVYWYARLAPDAASRDVQIIAAAKRALKPV